MHSVINIYIYIYILYSGSCGRRATRWIACAPTAAACGRSRARPQRPLETEDRKNYFFLLPSSWPKIEDVGFFYEEGGFEGQSYASQGMGRQGIGSFCEAFLCSSTRPCRPMPLLVHFWKRIRAQTAKRASDAGSDGGESNAKPKAKPKAKCRAGRRMPAAPRVPRWTSREPHRRAKPARGCGMGPDGIIAMLYMKRCKGSTVCYF